MTLALTDVQDAVTKIATNLAYNWPGIDRDDIAQEINVYLLENWKHLQKQVDSDEQMARFVRTVAEREGNSYCARERYYYQAHTSEWIYTPKEIRSVLVEYFNNPDFALDAPKRPDHGEQRLTGDGLSILAMDIESGIERLSESDQAALMSAYGAGEALTKTQQKAAQRAVDRLTSVLNLGITERFDHSDHEGPGARPVVTNTHARSMTDY